MRTHLEQLQLLFKQLACFLVAQQARCYLQQHTDLQRNERNWQLQNIATCRMAKNCPRDIRNLISQAGGGSPIILQSTQLESETVGNRELGTFYNYSHCPSSWKTMSYDMKEKVNTAEVIILGPLLKLNLFETFQFYLNHLQ